MTSVCFHYSDLRGVLLDQGAAAVNDWSKRADRVAQSLIMTASAED